MSKVIEETLKALTEFETQLDAAKADSAEAKRQMLKGAAEWAGTARASSVAEAQRIAGEALSKARKVAEAEAESIKKEGASALKSFQGALAKRKAGAEELVTERLLGESS